MSERETQLTAGIVGVLCVGYWLLRLAQFACEAAVAVWFQGA